MHWGRLHKALAIGVLRVAHRLHLWLLRGHLELDHDLGVKFLVPWHDYFCALAKRREWLRSNKEEVCQVNFGGGASLVNDKRTILTAQVEICQSESKNYCPSIGRKSSDIFLEDLIPSKLCIEPDLRQGWQSNILSDELRSNFIIKTLSLSSLELFLESLCCLDDSFFEVVDLAGQSLNAIMFLSIDHDHTAFFAANHSELTGFLVSGVVLLEHFRLTAKVCALDSGVVTLKHVLL